MSEITECLNTLAPRVLDFPATITPPSDPLSWALDLFKAAVTEADMQSMETSTESDSEQQISYFDQQDPATFQRFRSAILESRAVHGSLELIDYRDDGGTLRDNADWSWQIFCDYFAKGLANNHPLGHYLKATLWASCGEHRYKAHCDLADGFLMHLSGHKHVRVWPVPEQYLKKVIYDHRDFEGRMTSEPVEFELKPAQVLFIPAGSMHEVVAHSGQAAVSVSYHMGSPFPLMSLCAQLNKLHQGAEISLPQDLMGLRKFDITFFQPSRFVHAGAGDNEEMPQELAEALLGVLKSSKLNSAALHDLLSVWWRTARRQSIYPGPYP